MPQAFSSPPLDRQLASDQQDRARDRGRFTMYGMRVDARDSHGPDTENPGNGDHARRFGAGGDLSSYANRAPQAAQAPVRAKGSDAPAHTPVP